MRKTCFVIMGYGMKTDYQSGKKYDLDMTYENIIKPAVKKAGYTCIRGDEVQESGVIDKNMYGYLIHADLVIADITTFNPNAIYELGIRHAAKPFATIIMKNEEGNIPFDLNHNKILKYEHAGKDIFASEAKRCQASLLKLIQAVDTNQEVDSPFFQFVPGLTPHTLPEGDFNSIKSEGVRQETHLFDVVEKAKAHMKASNFIKAAAAWELVTEKASNDPYYIQQFALATYKSKDPDEHTALKEALAIIKRLDADGNIHQDPESLGIKGAIYKNLWSLNKDPEALDHALESYRKGFRINTDYYTGENYALCADLKAGIEPNKDDQLYYQVEAKKVRREVVSIITENLRHENAPQRHDFRWMHASMANALFGLGKDEEAQKHENKFRGLSEADWEIATYEKSKKQLFERLGKANA
ncbi:MAG: TRAFs-binding domain-containing protein [Bacteroidota bacterium]